MTIQVQSADGVIHQFPDGTNPAVIDGAMKAYVQQGKPAAKPQGLGAQVTGFMANVNRGTGIGDELAAGANAFGSLASDFLSGRKSLDPKDPGGSLHKAEADQFTASLARQRGLEAGYQQQHPHMAALAQGTGMAATAAIPAADTANVFAQGSRVGNALRGATLAGLNSAGYAAADAGTPAERLQAASKAATNPFALALGATGGALATRALPKAKPLSPDTLEAAKNAKYAEVDQSGVTYDPKAFKGLTTDMATALDDAGFHAGLHPKTAAMMERLGQSTKATTDYAPTLTQLDQLRQQIGRDVASSNDPGERRMGQIMRGKIDEFIANAKPEDLATSGAVSASDAAGLISDARDLNTRLSKVDAINEAAGKATRRAARTGSGGNIDNTTRQNMDQILQSVPNWTDEEKKALDSIVMGGKGQNLLRLVGKLSPSGNGLMAAGNLGAAALAGPAGAIPGAAGIIAKLTADGMTRAKVARLVAKISTVAPASTVAASAVSGPVAARLSRVAGVAAAAPALAPANPFAQP